MVRHRGTVLVDTNVILSGASTSTPSSFAPEGEGALALDAVLVTAPSPGALGSAAAQGQGRD